MTVPEAVVRPNQAFQVFWRGQSVSFLGTHLTIVALPLVAVLYLDATPVQMGLVVAAETAPHLLAPVLLGHLVDQADQRRMLLVADYGRLVGFACIPLALLLGLLTLPLLIAITFAMGVLTVLNDISFFSFVPRLVPPAALVQTNGRLESSRSVAMVVGPGLGGVLSQAIGAANVLLIDAATYVYSILQLHRLRGLLTPAPQEDPSRPRDPWYAGFREVLRRPALRLLAGGSGSFNFFSAGARALTVLFVVGQIGMSPGAYGVAIALGGLGGVAGGAVAHPLVRALGTRIVFAGSLLACGACEAALVLIREPGVLAFVILAGSHAVAMFGVTIYIVLNASIRQMIVPAHLRGRVFGTMRLIARGLMPLGALLCGLVGQFIGLRGAIIVVAVGELMVGVTFAIFSRLLPPLEH